MNKTSKLLVDYCYNDEIPKEPELICYYFGINNIKHIDIIFGVYQGLVKYKGVNENELHLALKYNKLNELIHEKYKNNKSGYYDEFCKLKLKVGMQLKVVDDIINYEVKDDDHCPNCGKDGYSKKNSIIDIEPDCNICFNMICKLCSKYDKKNFSRTCLKCISYDETKNLLQNIKNKIKSHNNYDENRFGEIGNVSVDDIKQLLNKQKLKCYICNDEIKTMNWAPYCCYQFSIDRIDDNKPHNRDNVLMSCYYCNCRQHPDFNQHNKICNQKCHTDKKENIPLKNNIDKSIIDKFRLG
jgi:hypothetical protein